MELYEMQGVAVDSDSSQLNFGLAEVRNVLYYDMVYVLYVQLANPMLSM